MGATAASLLGQARDGEVLLRSFSVPEPRLRYEFPYRAGMPLGIQRSSSPYLSSYMYEAISAEDHLEHGTGQTDEQDLKRQYRVQELARRYPPQYLRPYHAAKLVDARLDAVDVTRWTMVITDNELFVDLLSAYLLREYPEFPVFHKDTFLQALVDGDQRFCSPLLVNAIMAQACVSLASDFLIVRMFSRWLTGSISAALFSRCSEPRPVLGSSHSRLSLSNRGHKALGVEAAAMHPCASTGCYGVEHGVLP